MKNLAFIDGQNLYRGTRDDGWVAEHAKLRTFLKDRYHVETAYYHLGYFSEKQSGLYGNLQEAGFELVFKQDQTSHKKGNVDIDILFNIMSRLYIEEVIKEKTFDKILLISGDGDFYQMVEFLARIGRLEKVLFPSRTHSLLYKQLGAEYYDYLEESRSSIGRGLAPARERKKTKR